MIVGEVRTTLQALSQVPYHTEGGMYDDIIQAQSLIRQYFTESRKDQALTASDVEQLKLFYRERWDKVALTGEDYTTRQTGVNQHLINLASKLAESQLVKDPYLLLMPTLKTLKEEHSDELYANWPLSAYILNDAKTALISIKLMGSSFGFKHGYKIEGLDYDLTVKERRRLHLKDQTIPEALLKVGECEKLSEETVIALKQLVERVVSELGTYGEVPEGGVEFKQLIEAVNEFMIYVDCLQDEERRALMSHPVYGSAELPITFEEFLNRAWGSGAKDVLPDGKEKPCLTTQMHSLANIVCQYIPDVIFDNADVNRWVSKEKWAEDSRRIPFDKRKPFPIGEYKRRCLYLLIDILSHPFLVAGGQSLSFEKGCNVLSTQRVPQTAALLYETVMQAINGEVSFTEAYYQVKSQAALARDTVSLTRATDTQQWIDSIASGRYWLRERGGLSYEQTALRLLSFLGEGAYVKAERVTRYTDMLLRCLTSQSEWKSVEMAALCKRFYHGLDEKDKAKFKASLGGVEGDSDDKTTEQQVLDTTVYRALHYLSYKKVEPDGSMFRTFRHVEIRCDLGLRKKLYAYYKQHPLPENSSSLADRIEGYVASLPTDFRGEVSSKGHEKMRSFLLLLGDSGLSHDESAILTLA